MLDAFIQSDLHTQYCGQSPQEQFGVKCLPQGHNDMLTAVGFEPVTPWSEHQGSIHCATRLNQSIYIYYFIIILGLFFCRA